MTEPYTITVYCEKCEKHYWENIELKKELDEQARLNGIGSEREAKLMAQLEEIKKENLLMKDLVKAAEEIDLNDNGFVGECHELSKDNLFEALKKYREAMK